MTFYYNNRLNIITKYHPIHTDEWFLNFSTRRCYERRSGSNPRSVGHLGKQSVFLTWACYLEGSSRIKIQEDKSIKRTKSIYNIYQLNNILSRDLKHNCHHRPIARGATNPKTALIIFSPSLHKMFSFTLNGSMFQCIITLNYLSRLF